MGVPLSNPLGLRLKPAGGTPEKENAYGGVPPEAALFVSSNFWDVAGARSFGMRVCWINRAGAPPDQLGQQPTHVLRSLAELPALL